MTNSSTQNKRSSSGYPDDEKMLRFISLGVVSGEFASFAHARAAALLKFGYDNNEANRRRLWDWYNKGEWANWARDTYVDQEIKKRGFDALSDLDDPAEFRRSLIRILDSLILGYVKYGRMVDGPSRERDSDRYLFEDYLWNPRVSGGERTRDALEQLISSIVPAIHSVFETSLSMEDHHADRDGISLSYPVTKVEFTIDPSKPLPGLQLKRIAPGQWTDGLATYQYSNPYVVDKRWVEGETRRFKHFLFKHGGCVGEFSHEWMWPSKLTETSENNPAITMHYDYVPQVGAQPYVSVTPI